MLENQHKEKITKKHTSTEKHTDKKIIQTNPQQKKHTPENNTN